MGEEMRRVSMKELLKKRIAGEQRGAFIVFTALAVWFLMMFVAFAVDFGNYYQHRTRLQNAADAAALAGVAKYAESEPMTEKGMGRLVALPSNITEGQDGQAATFSSNSYTFTQIGGVPSDVHIQAEEYINNNYIQNNPNRNGVEMTDSMWNASQESTSTTSSQETWDGYTQTTTTTTPKQYCYRVDLEDTVTTFFARIFGMETLPIRVSAMAMLDGKQITTLEEQFVQISEQVSKFAANYYWETIVKRAGTITDAKTGEEEWTLARDSDNPNLPPPALGERDTRYFVVTGNGDSALSDVVSKTPKMEDGKIIIGYQEPVEPQNIGICAEPIFYEGDPADWDKFKKNVTTQKFIIDAEYRTNGVMEYNNKDIQVLYLNRDHIGQREGAREKFTEINIGRISGKTSDPLYLRLESEPICMSTDGKALMMAHGTTINITLTEAEVKRSRQFVFAYDGPDPKRGEDDAPWMSTSLDEVKIKNGSSYNLPGQIIKGNEPLLSKYNHERDKVPKEMAQSAMATSGPIDVYIDSGCVLYGAIFAPRSRVIIHGGGKIQGFILAREIVVQDGSYEVGERVVEMPVLIAERPLGNNYEQFHYRREYIKATYMMASSFNLSKLNTSFLELQ